MSLLFHPHLVALPRSLIAMEEAKIDKDEVVVASAMAVESTLKRRTGDGYLSQPGVDLTKITSLNLERNEIGAEVITHFAKASVNLNSLTSLDLSYVTTGKYLS
jgi:hypothetical protein